MNGSNTRISEKAGLPPGSVVYIGKKRTAKPKITVIDYNNRRFEEHTVEKASDCFKFKKRDTITWVNVDGIHDIKMIKNLGEVFEFHPLLLEDIVNTNQRSKNQDFDDYLYTVMKMINYNEKKSKLELEQISIILGKNFVLSFQEIEGDIFDPLRERIRKKKGKIRHYSADYLQYTMMDSIIDEYYLVVEKIGEKIEELQEELLERPNIRTLHKAQKLKQDLIYLRKAVWPLREVTSGLEKSESSIIRKSTRLYLRDLYEHTIQIIDNIEILRDMASGMIEIYLSSVSNKTNDVMKILTIIATIFMPLTFLAGIYGMNFRYFPEIYWEYGYALFWIISILITTIMILYFKNKKWI